MEQYDLIGNGKVQSYQYGGVPSVMYQGLLLSKNPDKLTEFEKQQICNIYTNVIGQCDLDYLKGNDWATKMVRGIEDFKDECGKFFKENTFGRIISNAVEQAVCGNFTDNITIEGTAAQVGLGLLGVDLPCDIRDLVADVKDLIEGNEVPWYQIVGDVIAVVPVIGALKYGDEVVTLVKNADIVSKVSKWADDVADAATDALNRFKSLWKVEPKYAMPEGFVFTESELDSLIKNADEVEIKAAKGNVSGGKTSAERAAEKGYPGISTTPNGGVDFQGSGYCYKGSDGKEAIVKIEMTGSRGRDFTRAFNNANIPKDIRKIIKENYTWHHVDDFNPKTGECTMQLVLSDAHVATYSHKGSVSQYEKYYNVEYK